jgi:16S rRNA (cytosine1402-N4)-methyltransferase
MSVERPPHISVLLTEVIAALRPHEGGTYVDGTLGNGGHAEAILDASGPDGRLLGIDADADALAGATARLSRFRDRFVPVHGNSRDIEAVCNQSGFADVDGVVLDLGLSSMQLERSRRGFSFNADEPLDMRFDATRGPTAAELLNSLPESELADIIYHYGEERASRRIARSIVQRRRTHRLATTADLVGAIFAAGLRRAGRLHPATRTFQALRIAVNDELGALDAALHGAARVLRGGGRLAVISFHSLEDRAVKRFLADRDAVPRMAAMTRKPIVASAAERSHNPRSRSAKLRVGERSGEGATP